MKKRVEKYIPAALKALQDANIVINGKYDNEYAGYISAFGPSVIQAGLTPTVAFYGRTGGDADRRKVGDAILKVIAPGENHQNFLNYVLVHAHDREETKRKILDAIIALKLAIRTFEKNE
jgi:CRISPR-associated protein Cmr5